jgi:methylglutaconyl-CoA hydratase
VSERLLSSVQDGVRTLTLNRGDKRNAIDTPMVAALAAALEHAELDAGTRVIAIRGAGPDFCAGADLQELLASADHTPQDNARHAHALGSLFVQMRELPKPVVGVVQGRALAGGCGLATACDIVLAHQEATFGYPEIKRGFVPAMVMAMLRRAVGEKTAFDLVATGRVLAAAEAAALGLITRVLPAASFDDDVGTFLHQLAGASPTALAFIKRQLYELDGRSFRDGIELGSEVNALARSTPDFKAAVAQFFAK